MTPRVEALLLEDVLTFKPVAGTFDVDRIAEAIGGIGFSFRDKTYTPRFVISATAASRDAYQARRLADPGGAFPRVLLVDVTAESVTVMPAAHEDSLRAVSAQFLEWFIAHRDCTIENENGADLTA